MHKQNHYSSTQIHIPEDQFLMNIPRKMSIPFRYFVIQREAIEQKSQKRLTHKFHIYL